MAGKQVRNMSVRKTCHLFLKTFRNERLWVDCQRQGIWKLQARAADVRHGIPVLQYTCIYELTLYIHHIKIRFNMNNVRHRLLSPLAAFSCAFFFLSSASFFCFSRSSLSFSFLAAAAALAFSLFSAFARSTASAFAFRIYNIYMIFDLVC